MSIGIRNTTKNKPDILQIIKTAETAKKKKRKWSFVQKKNNEN